MTKAPVRKPARARLATGLSVETPFANQVDIPDREKLADLNFKVSAEFHQRFKVAAAIRGMRMKALLEEAFEAWEREQQAKEKR